MTDDNAGHDPETIEQDIRRTQNDMSRTVDKLGDQLTARNLFNALFDKADQNGIDAHYLVDGARRNPIALGLIAAGAIWLVSDQDSKFPSLGSKPKKQERESSNRLGGDVHHRDYISYMSSLEPREGEDAEAYQRRRDLHRATFFMCERKPNEEESSFRQRLDEMTDSFRQKREAWMDTASETGSAAVGKARQLASQASTEALDLYGSNPLIGGLLAAALGATLGSAIPVSRTEQKAVGDIGAKARDLASDQKEKLTSKAMETKDELVDQIGHRLQPDDQRQPGGRDEPPPQPQTRH